MLDKVKKMMLSSNVNLVVKIYGKNKVLTILEIYTCFRSEKRTVHKCCDSFKI